MMSQKNTVKKGEEYLYKNIKPFTPLYRTIFTLTLFSLLIPLVLFNSLWFFRAEQAITFDSNLSFFRVCLCGSYLLLMVTPKLKASKNPKFVGGLIFVILLAVASQVNRFLSKHPDTNADSVTSHLLITEAIANGWSPLNSKSENSISISSSSLIIQSDLSIGRVETGIGFQTIQAFYNLFFGVESSYVFVNILFVSLAIMKLLEISEVMIPARQNRFFLGQKRSIIGLIAIFLMSPIIIQQLNSAYTDLSGYCLLTTCVLMSSKVVLDNEVDRNNLVSLIALIVVTPSIKLQLSAMMIPIVFAIIFTISRNILSSHKLFQKKLFEDRVLSKTAIPGILVVILALPALMYFPLGLFASEILKGRLPLHADKDWVARTWSGSIPEFMELNGLERVWTVISGRTSLNPDAIVTDGLFRIPTLSELKFAGYLDSRVAGFGPLFGDLFFASFLVVLIGFLVVYVQNFKQKRRDLEIESQIKRLIYFVYLTICFLIISLIIPLSFMARYNPQYLIMALLNLYVISILIRLKQTDTFPKLLLKSTFRTLVLIYVLNCLIVFVSYLEVKRESTQLMERMKVERVNLQKSGKYGNVSFYYGNKTGLILATTGEISPQNFTRNATLTCEEKNKVIRITDEVGICAQP